MLKDNLLELKSFGDKDKIKIKEKWKLLVFNCIMIELLQYLLLQEFSSLFR